MPELPEVETITATLRDRLVGGRLARVETFRADVRFPLTLLDDPPLAGRRILDVRRRARYIVIELEGLEAVVIHLGMTGSLRTVPSSTPRNKHEHVVFHLENGMTLRYDDPRRFGFLLRCPLDAPGSEPKALAELGVEPLTVAFSGPFLRRAAHGSPRRIKTLLMDNKVVVGVGNIYANEALFAVGLHPDTPAKLVPPAKLDELVHTVKAILRKAIAAGGTTISDYKDADGKEGKFQLELNVYGKDGQPCPICASTIVRAVTAGRGTFHCPQCQKPEVRSQESGVRIKAGRGKAE